MGLLSDFGDFIKTPEGQGLLSGVMGYAANARQGTPWNNLGRGGLAGLSGYAGALDRQQQLAEAEQMKKFRDMQAQQMKMQVDAAKRQAEMQQWQQDAAKRFATPATPAVEAEDQKPLNISGDTGPNLYSTSVSNMSTQGKPAVEAKPAGFDYEGYANELATRDPVAALTLRQSLQKDNTPVVVPEGGSLYKKDGTFLAMGFPKREPVPAEMQGYQLAVNQGYKGSFLDYQLAQKRAGASNQTMINAGPKAFDTELGKLDAEQLNEWRKNAQNAQSALQTVSQLRNADKSGAYAGTAANLKLTTGKFIESITGTAPKGTIASQEYNAAASNLVLEKIKALGANPSNADREFIEKTVPNLSQSAEARRALTDFMEQKARSSIDLYKRADAHARKKNGLGGFEVIPAEMDSDALVKKYLGGK